MFVTTDAKPDMPDMPDMPDNLDELSILKLDLGGGFCDLVLAGC